MNKWATYVSHPDVAWVVEKSGIRLIRKDTGTSELIIYPEAMLWELLSCNKPYERLVNIITAVAGLSKETAEHFIRKKVGDWIREGWLAVQASDG
jgi:hypothetical protein